jgi:hypothetical protein
VFRSIENFASNLLNVGLKQTRQEQLTNITSDASAEEDYKIEPTSNQERVTLKQKKKEFMYGHSKGNTHGQVALFAIHRHHIGDHLPLVGTKKRSSPITWL